jgi:Flp pilus assembly protein TadD
VAACRQRQAKSLEYPVDDREAELRRQLAEGPLDPEVTLELARLVGEQRDRKAEAVELLERHLASVEPEDRPAALLALGRAQVEARRGAEALATLRECTQTAPDNASAFELLGELLRRAGDLEAAEGALRRAVELQPGALQPQLALVSCLDELGRSDEAQEVLAGIQRSAAGDPAVAALLRELMHRRG